MVKIIASIIRKVRTKTMARSKLETIFNDETKKVVTTSRVKRETPKPAEESLNDKEIKKEETKKEKESFKKKLITARQKAKESDEDKIMLCEKMNFTGREAYKMLRTNLMFTLADSPRCKKVGVTSSIRGEGKSTTSINLAYTLAMADSKVLLVDLDLRLPSIAKRLDLESRYGISDYLSNTATKKDIIISVPKYKNFDVILSGTIPPNPSELIGTEALARFIKLLENSYDYIIFDLPPVNIVTDALAAKDLMDGQLIVVREGYSDKYSLANCIRQLQFVEMNILGFVFTNAGGTTNYYSKYRSYSKYKKYRYNSYKYGKKGYSYYRDSKYGYYK